MNFSPVCCHERCKGHSFCVYRMENAAIAVERMQSASLPTDPDVVDYCTMGHPIYRHLRYCEYGHFSATLTAINSGGIAPTRKDGVTR